MGAWIAVVGLIPFIAITPLAFPSEGQSLLAGVQATTLVLHLVSLATVRRPGVSARVVTGVAILIAASIAATATVAGIVTNDAITGPFLLGITGMATATLLPWGPLAQGAVSSIIAVAALVNIHAVHGLQNLPFVPAGILAGILVPMYAAHITRERARAERARLEAEARERREALARAARLSTMGGFAAAIAHELNQPLGAISIYAGRIASLVDQTAGASPELKPAAQATLDEALRAGEILARLRVFLRNGELETQELDANELVRRAARTVELEAAARHTDIGLDLATTPLPVRADPIQIEQVLTNLMRNGLDAISPEDGSRARLVLETRVQDDMVQIEVTDSGGGIPGPRRADLFTPFFTTKTEGLGLGLWISQSIVESHGGTLGLERTSEAGTTFSFSLPLHRKEAAHAA